MARAAALFMCDTSTTQSHAIVTIPVANIRTTPSHAAELSTQAVMGTPMVVMDTVGEWLHILLPDSYTGFIISSSVQQRDSTIMSQWREAYRVVAIAPLVTEVYADTLAHSSDRITWLPAGAIVEGRIDKSAAHTAITLPDGTKGFCDTDKIIDLSELANTPTDPATVLYTAHGAIGSPYLWGGTTLLAPDCSGLVKAAYFATGIILPRDASAQALCGIDIPVSRPDLWMQGDLLFFTGDNPNKITHVAIYDNADTYIHSSGKVFIASTVPSHPLYLNRPVVRVVRIKGAEGTEGITPLKSHPSYFNE